MKKKIIPCIALFSLLAAPAFSGTGVPAAISISPHSGLHIFSGKDRLDSAPVFGLKSSYEVVGSDLSDSIAVEGGFSYVATKTKNDEDADVYLVNVDALYPLFPRKRSSPYFALGAGGMYVDRPEDSFFNPLLNYGLGMRYFFHDAVFGRVDARHIIEFDEERRNNFQFIFGISFLLTRDEKLVRVPVVDRDRDGVPDGRDRCPDTPAGVKLDSSGCPVDSDADGVADYLDKCAETPKGIAVDKNGCPVDSDGDGVSDQLDKCPGTTQGEKVGPDGCPLAEKTARAEQVRMVEVLAGVIRRNPIVGVGDAAFVARREEPGFAKLYANLQLEQTAKPRVASEIPEGHAAQQKLTDPEISSLAVSEDVLFCPEEPVPLFRAEGAVKEYGVLFAFDSSRIGSNEMTPRKLALFLKYNPMVTAVIEGHADRIGDARYNLALSRSRASRMKKILVEKYGIAADRIKTAAYGCSRPVAANGSEEGRRENRRAVTIVSVRGQ